MRIRILEQQLQEGLEIFKEESKTHIAGVRMDEPLDYYDYEELTKQVFYLLDHFSDKIIDYLRKQEKTRP